MRPEVTTFAARPSRRTVIAGGLALCVAGFFSAGGPVGAAEASEIGVMKPQAAHKAALAGDIILIDIRRPDEWEQTRVAEGAIGLDMREDSFVPTLVALRRANPDTPIALICRTGNRTGYVTDALAKQGFPSLVDVREGMEGGPNGPGWLKRGLPTYPGTLQNVTTRRKALLP